MTELLLDTCVDLVGHSPAEVRVHGDERRRNNDEGGAGRVIDEREGRVTDATGDAGGAAAAEVSGVRCVGVVDGDDVRERGTAGEGFAVGRIVPEVAADRAVEETATSVNDG